MIRSPGAFTPLRASLALLLLAAWLAACAPLASPTPTPSPQATRLHLITHTHPAATPNPTLAPTSTLAPARVFTPTATIPPTPTPVYLTATVWPHDPQVAILLYHRFIPDSALPYSTTVKTRLGDFRSDLERLYAAGYSLIPLDDWLKGRLVLPPGRRPLILTMDDLFFADQIFLNPDGTPSIHSGIGVLWQFSQEHPDFGFSIALFANLGDKYYANEYQNGRFLLGPDWQDSLAQAIVWCIEHGAIPYNHTYNHPRLDLTPGDKLQWELSQNDATLRAYLARAGRLDLVSRLDNLVALPYSIWPASDAGKKLLETYVSPEGTPVQAIFEADYAYRPRYMPAPYLPTFDRYHLPRMEGLQDAMRLMETHQDLFPPVSACPVGPLDPAKAADAAYLAGKIKLLVASGACQPGVYALNGWLFRATAEGVSPITLPAAP